MARIDERNPDGAEGEWFIDERCIGCGASASVAPGLIVQSGSKYVFAQQPDTDDDVDRAWLARELCPTRSIGTMTRTDKREPFPHQVAPGIHLCGHNDKASFGAHSFLIERDDGNVLVDSPRHTFKLARPFEAMGGLSLILLTHRDDVADAQKWSEKFDARALIHSADHAAAPFAETIEGDDPVEVAPGILAIPVPGHTEGSVVFLVDDTWLFTGDSLAWSHSDEQLYAFADACWFDWGRQTESLRRLAAEHRFEQVFAGHGASSPRLGAEAMQRHLLSLVERMPTQR